MKTILSALCLLALCNSADAEHKHQCAVSYLTKDGWSEPVAVEVNFVTGDEINDAIGRRVYERRWAYAQIWFGPGQVATIKFDHQVRISAYNFDRADFKRAIRGRRFITGVSQDETKWALEPLD